MIKEQPSEGDLFLQDIKAEDWKEAERMDINKTDLEENKKMAEKVKEELDKKNQQINEDIEKLQSFIAEQGDKDGKISQKIEEFKSQKKEFEKKQEEILVKISNLEEEIEKIKANPIFSSKEKDLKEAYQENKERDEKSLAEEKESLRKKEIDEKKEDIKKAEESLVNIWKNDEEHILRWTGDDTDPWSELNARRKEIDSKEKDLKNKEEEISAKEKNIFKFGVKKLQEERNQLEKDIKYLSEQIERENNRLREKQDELYKKFREAEEMLGTLLTEYQDLCAKMKYQSENKLPKITETFPYATIYLGDEKRKFRVDLVKLFKIHKFNPLTRETKNE